MEQLDIDSIQLCKSQLFDILKDRLLISFDKYLNIVKDLNIKNYSDNAFILETIYQNEIYHIFWDMRNLTRILN